MNIAVTGFYGTGSSAVIDLLREYKGVGSSIGERYEHYPFLLKDCIIDLENRIFSNNSNYMIVDYALNCFYDEMKRQNDNDFGWYGSYKRLYQDKFMKLVDTFLDNVSESLYDKSNLPISQAKGIKFSLIKCCLQLGAKILKGYKVSKWGRVYCYHKKPRRYLKVDHKEFMVYAKEFINGYFELTKSNKITIYDHLLLPEQCLIVDKFFDDDFRLIIVDRDPRDIYISTKYIWSTIKFGMQKGPFPKGIESFCGQWRFMHNNLKDCISKKVLVINFENLIYDYDNTVAMLEKFCGLSKEDHVRSKEIFEPNKSINNTQVYKLKDDFKGEVNTIEKLLTEYLYEFPYKIDNKLNDVFDA